MYNIYNKIREQKYYIAYVTSPLLPYNNTIVIHIIVRQEILGKIMHPF
jgi:hypothetical protein